MANLDDTNILTAIPKHSYREPAQRTNWTEFRAVIDSRRSVRVFTNEPIPESTMRECLDIALLAPTSSNLQCWEFYWVRNQAKKDHLIKACFSQSAARTAAELVVCVARTNTWKSNNQMMLDLLEKQPDPSKGMLQYYRKITRFVYNQGPLGSWGLIKRAGLFFVGLTRPVPREPNSKNEMKIWAVKTTALACENLMLALRAAGFDSCPMEGMDSKRVRKLLELPSDALVVMVIGAGQRAENGVYGPRIRFDRSLFIHEV